MLVYSESLLRESARSKKESIKKELAAEPVHKELEIRFAYFLLPALTQPPRLWGVVRMMGELS